MTARRPVKLEVHEHSYVTGPNSNCNRKIVHSHDGGERPHKHDDAGPAAYTIDKDEWQRATGLRGGGRKKFTATPIGPQMEPRDLADWQKTFDVIVVAGPETSAGPTDALPARLILENRIAIGRVIATARRGERGG